MILYRLAQSSDAPQLADLRWRLRAGDAPLPDAAKARFIGQFVSWMDKNSGKDLMHWVAEQDGALIGVISVRIIPMLPSPEGPDDRFGYLTNSYVLPQHRDKGIGTALLAAVKDWALGERLELLAVWPSERAYPFYQRSGYRRYPDPVILKLRGDGGGTG
jgi:GNAT superfamily N-acetyltransferase